MNERIEIVRQMVNEVSAYNGKLKEFNYHKMENVDDVLEFEHKGEDFNSNDEYFIANKDRTASSLKAQELQQLLIDNSGIIFHEVAMVLSSPSTNLYLEARLRTLVRLLFKDVDMRSKEAKERDELRELEELEAQ